jgi:opacity protein-like surface antigen
MKHGLKIFFLMICLSTFVFCQSDSSKIYMKQLSISGGVGFPILPHQFPDNWKRGFGFEVGYGFVFNRGDIGYASVYGAIEYNQFSFLEQTNRQGSSLSVITGMVNFKGAFSSSSTSPAPYFLVGIGVLNRTTDDQRILSSIKKSKTGFAWQAGAGMEFPLTETVTAFAEGKFVLGIISDPGFQYLPVNIGTRIKI